MEEEVAEEAGVEGAGGRVVPPLDAPKTLPPYPSIGTP